MKILRYIVVVIVLGLIASFVGFKIYNTNLTKSHIIQMRVLKDQWKFSPESIKIPVNEAWKIRIYNEDTYEHGFFIEELGVNATLAPGKTTEVTVTATKPGEYIFVCSVICGAGHYRMSGKLTVTN